MNAVDTLIRVLVALILLAVLVWFFAAVLIPSL